MSEDGRIGTVGRGAPARLATRWLSCRNRRPGAGIRVYCFPHSGGSVGEYLRWDEYLPEVEVWGVQLPARGARLGEPPLLDMPTLVDAVLDGVEFEPPFALLGHSLGALVAYEVTSALRGRGRERPDRLLLSASAPPHRRPVEPRLHLLPDDELMAEVERRYGGLSPELAAHPELVELMLPACRGDFTVCETYRYTPREPLDCPITVIGGAADTVPVADLAEWERYTSAGFRLEMLPGGHFYFRDQLPAVAGLIGHALRGPSLG